MSGVKPANRPIKSAEEWMPKKAVDTPSTTTGSRARKAGNPHAISDEQIKGIETNVAARKKAKSQYNSINTEEHKRY